MSIIILSQYILTFLPSYDIELLVGKGVYYFFLTKK